MTPEEHLEAFKHHVVTSRAPGTIPGAGTAGGTFIDFLDDAAIDTKNPAMSLTYREAELWAVYIARHYVVIPREGLE